MTDYITEVVNFMKYCIEKYGLFLTYLALASLIILWKLDVIILAFKA